MALLDLAAEVEMVYQACLAKQAEARPTAAAVLTWLQQAATRLGLPPYTPPDVYSHTAEHEMMQWHNWSLTYFNFGHYKEALTRNNRSFALTPSNPVVLINRGNTLAALGQPKEALVVYDRALAVLPPEDIQLHEVVLMNRGMRLSEVGRYKEADAAYAQALALAADNALTWHNRANNQLVWASVEDQAGHPMAVEAHLRVAVAFAERAVALSPHNTVSRRLLNDLHRVLDSEEGK